MKLGGGLYGIQYQELSLIHILEGLKRFGEDLNQSLEGVVEQLQKEGKVYQGLITKITILEEKLKEGQERAKQIELHLEKLREDVGCLLYTSHQEGPIRDHQYPMPAGHGVL